MVDSPFNVEITPDWQALVDCITRRKAVKRVHFIELYLDPEVKDEICSRYALAEGLNPTDPYYAEKREVILQRFLGYDYVRCGLEGLNLPLSRDITEDSAGLKREGGRSFINSHVGPVTTWQEFEAYPWPDANLAGTRSLDWYETHLPEDMCMIGSGGFAHFAEYLTWLMGYETLCFALYEQRDLVEAIARRLFDLYQTAAQRLVKYDRMKILWGSDDMGFRSGTLIKPQDLREFVLPEHQMMAEIAHRAGKPYLLHSCGKLDAIMDDLIDVVKIDARHSFEDVIEPVIEAKRKWGNRVALLGGVDVDFLCRASEEQVRLRVRQTLDACLSGGGYCLGTGNSVANYIPLGNYLAMLDEGRKYQR